MTSAIEDAILVEHADGISRITFNRPDRLNAIDPPMLHRFMDLLHEVDDEPTTNVIVITGSGRGFSSGGDIGSFGSAPDHHVRRRGWHLIQRMLQVEKPMIARINGPAVGLGLVIALLTDVTIAAEGAKLGDPHVSLGLVAGDGLAVLLPVLIGPQRAKELLMSSRNITAVEAVRMGMIGHAVPADELDPLVDKIAAELAAQPAYAARATKAVVNRYLMGVANESLELSLAYEEISRGLPAYPEAVARWRAGRAQS